ncbi:MAG: glutamate synthase large subunit, partial [Halobacteriales archaeon]|nr:glutamate synthase large subunit [Halobacteriales archaeon]
MVANLAGSCEPALLIDPKEERSSCGVGAVMDLEGEKRHSVVKMGMEVLSNMIHRGAIGIERDAGDGAGIMLQIPHEFFKQVIPIEIPSQYGTGLVFFPQDGKEIINLKNIIEEELSGQGLEVRYWRSVPTDNQILPQTVRNSEPAIFQPFIVGEGYTDEEFDRRLYLGRRMIEKEVQASSIKGKESFWICSLDRRIIVYKGLLRGNQIDGYYKDLKDENLKTSFALVHIRFSTNTSGSWNLAHPYRRLIHNGEFNTIKGNVNWMNARESNLEHPEFGERIEELKPIIADGNQSDSASLDNVLELLLATGRSLPHALRMLIPDAWQEDANLVDEERKDWYKFHASLVEPWDGPSLVIATDGERIGAILDRNGLRPCRYDVTSDNVLVMASEAGVLEIPPEKIIKRGRLGPGQLFLAEPGKGIYSEEEILKEFSDPKYKKWVESNQIRLEELVERNTKPRGSVKQLRQYQAAFGYTYDELDRLIKPMLETGKDPVGSMGDDTPLAILSEFNRPLSSYFRQLFAQVTNPPVDNIRESLVFSLETRIGHKRNILNESEDHAKQLVLKSPILTDEDVNTILHIGHKMQVETVEITYDGKDLEKSLESILEECVEKVKTGSEILVLTDRNVDKKKFPIPSLLAVSSVHHHLIRNGLRTRVGIVVESGDPRTVHQMAALIGHGAGAINPYLAYQTIEDIVNGSEECSVGESIEAYIKALEEGLLKVMSKIGISTIESYKGAQTFESIGLNSKLIDEHFTGTANRIEGIGIKEIEGQIRERHQAGFSSGLDLERQGEFEFRTTGIHHQWNPKTVSRLQQAVRTGEYAKYQEFAELINEQNGNFQTLRGLLEFEPDREPVLIEEVEPVSSIVQRFSSAAMSLGSLSEEAHENTAIGMNRIGGKSNTGEGGEPPERFGTEKGCSVKQVASGRFGVTSYYLASANELQIKMAQGSKPGEGGQLPGHKVNEMIARVRRSVPGVGLISPPPQHDIYSIEDLKQLIYDLKCSNPKADINVKLVAEAGIGQIAAGVAKANADVIHISGHSGGSGASPRTSIKHAGSPWELGLSEANQMLCATGLRSRVKLSVDGGIKTGRDVAIAAMLGAEEYVFGTGSLVAGGCVMARQCHNNTCPVGIATQDPKLRDRFRGEPEHVMNYMEFIAQDLREIMASLGFRKMEEMIGRANLLQQREVEMGFKVETLDLSPLTARITGTDRYKTRQQTHLIENSIDWEVIDKSEGAISKKESVEIVDLDLQTSNRAFGTILSNRISKMHGEEGLPEDTIIIKSRGTAGQSFGAFLARGVTILMKGIGNDYVGKGLSGGKIAIMAP